MSVSLQKNRSAAHCRIHRHGTVFAFRALQNDDFSSASTKGEPAQLPKACGHLFTEDAEDLRQFRLRFTRTEFEAAFFPVGLGGWSGSRVGPRRDMGGRYTGYSLVQADFNNNIARTARNGERRDKSGTSSFNPTTREEGRHGENPPRIYT